MKSIERRTERIARDIARAHGHEALWELYLHEAYARIYGLPERDASESRREATDAIDEGAV